MLDSIIEDIKGTFRSGNMVSRLILVSVVVYLFLTLLRVLDYNGTIHSSVLEQLSLTSDLGKLIFRPWVLLTHMFTHTGFWDIVWNMLLLYWFGRIVGDLLGDKRILPLYIVSGLFSALIFIFWDQVIPGGSSGLAISYGSSGAVMAFIFTAATLSPDYMMRLLLLGDVRLKYIALGLLVMKLLMSSGSMIGFIIPLSGAIFGVAFVSFLRKGFDMTAWFKKPDISTKPKRRKTSREKFTVVHKEPRQRVEKKAKKQVSDKQSELDRILDKINEKGIDHLSDEEKEFLSNASKD